MEIGSLIGKILATAGLTPACIIALVAMLILYRLNTNKDRVIEKQSESIRANTAVMIEIKTLLTAFLPRRQP